MKMVTTRRVWNWRRDCAHFPVVEFSQKIDVIPDNVIRKDNENNNNCDGSASRRDI